MNIALFVDNVHSKIVCIGSFLAIVFTPLSFYLYFNLPQCTSVYWSTLFKVNDYGGKETMFRSLDRI